MKLSRIGSIVLCSIILSGGTTALAYGKGLAVYTDTGASVQVQSSTGASGSASAEVTTSRESSTGQASGKTTTGSNTGTSRDSATGQATGKIALPLTASATATAAVSVRGWDVETKQEIVLRREGKALGTTSVVTVSVDAATVTSVDDLKALAEKILASDPNVKLIKLSPTSAEVDYQYRGKLLGVIPVRAVMSADVNADGKVKVKFPWYSIFVKKTTVVAEAELQSEVSASLEARGFQNALQRQAQAVQTLSHILKTRHEASVQASATIN